MLSGHPVLGSLTHSCFWLDSLNVPPQHMAAHTQFTFLSSIVLSTHRNDQSFIIKLKMTSVYSIFVQRMCPALWFPVLSQVLATTGQVQFWFINTGCRIMVKLKDTFSTEMGNFKLYNAWHIKAGSIFFFGKKQLLNISLSGRPSHADADHIIYCLLKHTAFKRK